MVAGGHLRHTLKPQHRSILFIAKQGHRVIRSEQVQVTTIASDKQIDLGFNVDLEGYAQTEVQVYLVFNLSPLLVENQDSELSTFPLELRQLPSQRAWTHILDSKEVDVMDLGVRLDRIPASAITVYAHKNVSRRNNVEHRTSGDRSCLPHPVKAMTLPQQRIVSVRSVSVTNRSHFQAPSSLLKVLFRKRLSIYDAYDSNPTPPDIGKCSRAYGTCR